MEVMSMHFLFSKCAPCEEKGAQEMQSCHRERTKQQFSCYDGEASILDLQNNLILDWDFLHSCKQNGMRSVSPHLLQCCKYSICASVLKD